MVEIKGLQKTSLIDYPDRVSCIVFLPGCNFRCPYCQNPDLIKKPDKLPALPEKKFFTFLEKRKKVLDGVVITGGEPTLSKDLPEFIRKIKSRGLLVKLDTNGSSPGVLEKLLKEGLLDYIAMDIKAPLDKYDDAAGVNVDKEKIKKSINIIKNSGVDYEFRTTVVPRLLSLEDLIKIGEELKRAKKYVLQQFRPLVTLDRAYQKERPYPKEKLMEIAERIKPFFGKVEVRA
jgi:pyruvate formate lyase activating enzyme